MGPLKENPTGYDEFYALWAFLSHSSDHVHGGDGDDGDGDCDDDDGGGGSGDRRSV